MKLDVTSGIMRKKSDTAHHHTAVTKPSDPELFVFEKHLESLAKKGKGARILIIGSSPELRELAARKNVHATIVANDLEVIERTTKLMKKRNKEEEWLEGDIIVLPLKKKSFDMIFGDHVISNVSPFNKERFYERMREILKTDGSVVIRSLVFKKTAKPFENRVSKYFRIVEKKFAKEGIFSEYFPIYSMKPK
jgi:ubiquinone/menaquinone biosynthesis C-methylase UbiE